MTVEPILDLALSKGASPDPVSNGDTLTYTLSVANNGLSPATGTTLTDILPPGVSYVSATASQGTCGHSAGTVNCNLGDCHGRDPGRRTADTWDDHQAGKCGRTRD